MSKSTSTLWKIWNPHEKFVNLLISSNLHFPPFKNPQIPSFPETSRLWLYTYIYSRFHLTPSPNTINNGYDAASSHPRPSASAAAAAGEAPEAEARRFAQGRLHFHPDEGPHQRRQVPIPGAAPHREELRHRSVHGQRRRRRRLPRRGRDAAAGSDPLLGVGLLRRHRDRRRDVGFRGQCVRRRPIRGPISRFFRVGAVSDRRAR